MRDLEPGRMRPMTRTIALIVNRSLRAMEAFQSKWQRKCLKIDPRKKG